MKTTKLLLGVFFASMLFLASSCVKEVEVTYGSIQGIVTNASTNEPIQGVNITLSPTGLSAVTGSDGRYEFTNLTAGQYTVQGVKSGYESNTKNITIVAGNISSGDMTLAPEVAGFRLNVEYLDFGTNFSELNFKIINTSNSLPISWSITESIAWMTATPSSGNLNAGQEVSVIVKIDRSQIEQNTTANLTVNAADQTIVLPVNVSVSGSSGPQLQLSETSLDFGTSATSLSFYVMNTGPVNTSLNWTCSNITVDWLELMPTSGNTAGGSSTPVLARIDRTKIDGMVSTSVTVSGAGSSATISISAATEGSGAAILQLSEGSIDFGETENNKTFMVKNVGSAGTVLDWTIATPSVDWLTLTPMTGNTNAGSGTQVTAVVDRNKIHGTVSTTITVNGSNNSANLSISAANFVPNLEVSSTNIDFGKIDNEKTIMIKNTGDEGSVLNWRISTPTVNWLTVTSSSGGINANQSKPVSLAIDRTKFDGDVSTTLTVTAGDQSVILTITASTAVPNMNVTPTTIDFGKIDTQKTFQVKNIGDEGSVLNWRVSNPTVDWLTVSPASGSVNADQSKTVNLTIDRTKFDGDVSTTLTVSAGDQNATVNITASTAQATMSVPVTSIDFGTVSSQETFQIKNVGEEGSLVNWRIANPSVNWLTVSPMSGSTSTTSPTTVTLNVDRDAFVGVETTNITITGADATATVTLTIDNSVIVTNGLVAYYSFDDGNVTDWSGNNNGFNMGALPSTDTPGGEGQSLEFDGYASYLQIPYNLFGGGPWSYNMWFKTTQNATTYRTFFGTNSSDAYMTIYSEGKLYIKTGSYNWMTNSISSFFNSQWHMLTITYNGSLASLYIDGVLFEVKQNSGLKWPSICTNSYIGGNMAQSTHYFFNGKLDNIRTYSRALTENEIRALYNAKQ